MEIKNKVAIVTGASAGIGLATAKLLSEKGAKLALVARSKDKLEQLAKSLPNAIAVPADMTKIDQIKAMIQKTKAHFGQIDILVNNAGQGYDATIEKTDTTIFHYIFDLDVVGPVVAMQQVVPIMRKQGEGAIVNVSSGAALMYLPGMGAYSAFKRALANISLTAREELKDDKIAVSVIYPYITLTDFEKNTIKESSLSESSGEEGGGSPFPADTAEYVAQKIVQGIETGEAEIFVHDWMKNLSRREH
jgi:short-subunit dehydrogenase